MGTKAYVLIEVAVGKAKMVADEILSLEGVKTVDVVMGTFDIIAVVNASDVSGRRVSRDGRHPHHRRRPAHSDVSGRRCHLVHSLILPQNEAEAP